MTQTSPTPPSPSSLRLICALAVVLSACSLLYELLIAQTLATIVGNIVICYSLVVGIYLAAMGAGAMWLGARPEHREDTWQRLFTLELKLSLIGASVVLLLYAAHTLHLVSIVKDLDGLSRIAVFASGFAMTFVVGLLTGMELPLLLHLGRQSSAGARAVNRVLGWDYIGALCAGLLFPLALAPYLTLHAIGFSVALANLAAAAFIHARFLQGHPRTRVRRYAITGMALALGLGLAASPHIEQFKLKKYYYYVESSDNVATLLDPLEALPPVERRRSPYQNIDLVSDPDPERFDLLYAAYSTKSESQPHKPKNQYLFLNGAFQTSSNNEEIYHEYFAHVPIIARGRVPKRVLVMGAGEGFLLRELVKYEAIERIVHVDIDPKLVDMARRHPILTALNDRALDDPRIETVIADAFQYLRDQADGTFDAVYLDFPPASNYNLSRLYSREFYHFVLAHLSADGFAVLDSPGLQLDFNRDDFGRARLQHAGTWDVHEHTMRQAGFQTVLPYYSILEADNLEAYDLLTRTEKFKTASTGPDAKLDSDEAKQIWLEGHIKDFTSSVRQGFILLLPYESDGRFDYVDFGIPTHVMNAQRFELAVPIPPDRSRPIVAARVNSILRPTVPRGGFGRIRRPW